MMIRTLASRSLCRGALVVALLALSASCGGGGDAGAGGSGTTTTATSSSGAGGSGTSSTGGGPGGAGTASSGETATSGTSTSGTGGMATSGTGGGTGGGPVDGYGALSMCPSIGAPEILSASPSLVNDTLDFTGYPVFDASLLSPGGKAMFAAGNLNSSSLDSEIFAYEVLYRCDGATFLKGEGQIVYAVDGKKTDLLVDIGGHKVGVSVVRAESYPKGASYPVSQAYTVLQGKLDDILHSTANVAPQDAWEKQILAVMAQTPEHALAIEEAFGMVDAVTKADTIVVITVTEGDDDFIYYN